MKMIAAVAFVMMSASALQAAETLSGQWIDTETGDIEIDFGRRSYSGVDDGCSIDHIRPKGKDRWQLAMSCGQADTKRRFKRSIMLSKTARGLRLGEGADFQIDLVPVRPVAGSVPPPKPPQTSSTYDEKAWASQAGPGLEEIKAWARAKTLECYRPGSADPVTCSALEELTNPRIHRSQGAVPAYAVLQGITSTGGGNSFENLAALFRREADGRYRFVADVSGYYGIVTAVEMADDAFYVKSDTLQGNDGRCCPTGKTVWKGSYATGQAVYLKGNKVP